MKKQAVKQKGPTRIYTAPANLLVTASQAAARGGPRPRVYLDSTIPSVYCDDREVNHYEAGITRRWWHEESHHYEVWISPATMAELSDGHHPHKARILEFADKIALLTPEAAVDELAQYYIQNRVMPQTDLGDAWHLAYATYHRVDFLLTWNCNHLANANKRRHLEVVNHRAGYATPQIVTPLELFSEREDL